MSLAFIAVAWLLGMIGFLALPVIGFLDRRASDVYIWLALFALKRACVAVSEHGELLLKRIRFSSLGFERASFGDVIKYFEDPAHSITNFKGFAFALGDEQTGVLFDPRYAWVGEQKARLEEQLEWEVDVDGTDADRYGVVKWIRGVLELPKQPTAVSLTQIDSLLAGGERAETPDSMEKIYEKSQSPFKSTLAWLRLALPFVAFIGTFAGMWWVADQASGSGASSTISFGLLALWASGYRKPLAGLAMVLLTIGYLAILGPVSGFIYLVAAAAGFLFLPLLVYAFRMSTGLSEFLARKLLQAGLVAYQHPNLHWTSDGYVLRDADVEGPAYQLAGSRVTFSFDPEGFEDAKVDKQRLEAIQESPESLPAKYLPSQQLSHANVGAFVPKRLSRGSEYIKTFIPLNRFWGADRGERSLKKLTEAKEKYGGGLSEVSDSSVLKYTLGSTLAAAALGTVVFFV